MKTAVKKKSKYNTTDGLAYLTKRTVVAKAKAAGKKASAAAMHTMGFVVTVKGKWIIRKYADGRIERISSI
jgi:hypothetical protein